MHDPFRFAPATPRFWRRPVFEGWYFKLVGPGGDRAAIIPGVYLGRSAGEGYAFVQLLDWGTRRVHVGRDPLDAFARDRGGPGVSIGPNRFGPDRLTLDFDDGGIPVRGDLRFDGLTPWPSRPWSPSAMGWMGYLPFMQCYQDVTSLRHAIRGELRIGDRRPAFDGGIGYTERTWGTSFPSAYIWIQCNHFDDPGASLTLAAALVPMPSGAIRGVMAGLLAAGRLHRLGTYGGASLSEATAAGGEVRVAIRSRGATLDVAVRSEAAVDPDRPFIGMPDRDGLRPGVAEVLDARISVRLAPRRGDVVRLEGGPAALELVRPELVTGSSS